jgi:hypothetical protein
MLKQAGERSDAYLIKISRYRTLDIIIITHHVYQKHVETGGREV